MRFVHRQGVEHLLLGGEDVVAHGPGIFGRCTMLSRTPGSCRRTVGCGALRLWYAAVYRMSNA
jgi:hypothetical protein